MRELRGGKLVGFVDIGGGLKAFRAEQSHWKKVHSGMDATDLLFDLDSYYSSTFPIDV